MSAFALSTKELSLSFGAFHAVSAVNINVAAGQRHALIGPNGAGKTSLINLLTGIYKPTSGQVLLEGENITQLAFNERVQRGLARTFQLNTLCLSLTPFDVVMMALSERERLGHVWWKPLYAYEALRVEAQELLLQVGLASYGNAVTGELAYGKQRLLEIALALALKPKVLLLDEPTAGIPEGESDAVFELIAQLPAQLSVIFIEHDMDLVFNFAQRISVLVSGRVLVEGCPQEIIEHPLVREAYLGADFYAKNT